MFAQCGEATVALMEVADEVQHYGVVAERLEDHGHGGEILTPPSAKPLGYVRALAPGDHQSLA